MMFDPMPFNSMLFVVFFVVVLIVYYSLPHRFRWVLLLLASYYFYMCWKMEYGLLLAASTLVNYVCGLRMGSKSSKGERKKYLVLSLVASLGLLFAFKYFNFFNESARLIFNKFNFSYHVPMFNVMLPLGISFYTFKGLSYTIDIYRGHSKPERHLGFFALYVAFLPQLLAGPIERSSNLLPQIREKSSFDYQRTTEGLRLILWGMFKKVVIADRLAFYYVNQIYDDVHSYQGLPLLFATYFFAIQIYCDFSGYSDIAVGTAKIMGYDTMRNFERPYFARSVSQFWRRWHISLTSWFRDYLYIPLGGSRCSKARHYFNILIVFLVSGLWHGANWTFIIWGGLNGVWQVISISTERFRRRFTDLAPIGDFGWKVVRVLITFHLICFGWIFFRANSLSDALYVVTHIPFDLLNISSLSVASNRFNLMLTILTIPVLLVAELAQRARPDAEFLNARFIGLRWLYYYLILFSIIAFGFAKESLFIYFQF